MRLSWISRASFLTIGGSALLLAACAGSSTDDAPNSAASDPTADAQSVAAERNGASRSDAQQSQAAEPAEAADEQAAADTSPDTDSNSDADSRDAEPQANSQAQAQAQAEDQVQPQTDAAAVVAAVSGAPVPPPSVAAAEFDEERHFVGANFPSLNDPVVVLADDATWLQDDTLVLGAVRNGDARAYPVFMMTYHHIANDTLGGLPYLVTY